MKINVKKTLTWLGDTKKGFSYNVGPPKLPPKILIGFKQNLGPTCTKSFYRN
jgi:hypothetical protein